MSCLAVSQAEIPHFKNAISESGYRLPSESGVRLMARLRAGSRKTRL